MPTQKEKTNPKIQKPADSGESEQLRVPTRPNISSEEVTPAPDNPVPVQSSTGRVTRASNKTNRPGLVDVSPPPKKRRTGVELIQHKQEIANAKQAKKDAAERAAEVQQHQQLEVAHMEDSIANKEESSRIHAARPPLGEILTKVSRPVSNMVNIEAEHQAPATASGYVSEHSGGDHEDDEDYHPSDGEKSEQPSNKRKRASLTEDNTDDANNTGITRNHANNSQVQPPSPIRKATGRGIKKAPQPTIREQVQVQRAVKERRADDHWGRPELAARSRVVSAPNQSNARLAEGNASQVRPTTVREQRPSSRPAQRLPTPNPTPDLNVHLSSRWESTASSGIRPRHQADLRRAPPAATGPATLRSSGPAPSTRTQSQPASTARAPRHVPPLAQPSGHLDATTRPPTANERETARRPPVHTQGLQSAQQWHRLPPTVVKSSQLGPLSGASRSSTPRSSTPLGSTRTHGSGSSSTAPTSSDPITRDGDGNSRRDGSRGPVQPFHHSRTQHQVVADVVPRKPAERQQKNGHRKKEKEGAYSLSDLPPGTESGWSNVLIPMWNEFSGSLENPWDTSDNNILSDLVAIWEIAFPHVPVEITRKCAVYSLALQKWYDWRGRIARRAQSALKVVLERFKPADRLTYAEWLLSDGMPCMWQNAAERGKFVGLYRSELVLKTFAEHLTSTSKVPEEDQLSGRPIGALALAAVSVERAINLYIKNATRDNPDAKEENDRFSESKYGKLTTQYVESMKKLKPSAWDAILQEASLFAKESKDTTDAKGVTGADADTLDPNRRANLEEHSDDDEGGGNQDVEYTRSGEYTSDGDGNVDDSFSTEGGDSYAMAGLEYQDAKETEHTSSEYTRGDGSELAGNHSEDIGLEGDEDEFAPVPVARRSEVGSAAGDKSDPEWYYDEYADARVGGDEDGLEYM